MTKPTQSASRFPIPGPHDPQMPQMPQMPPADDLSGYVFPTWRAALSDAQVRIADAYEKRRRLFVKASEAGLSYREIGEATGLSAAGVGKIIGRDRTTLDSPVSDA